MNRYTQLEAEIDVALRIALVARDSGSQAQIDQAAARLNRIAASAPTWLRLLAAVDTWVRKLGAVRAAKKQDTEQ